MKQPVIADLPDAWRQVPYVQDILFPGQNLEGGFFRMQLRLVPGSPGAPEVDLQQVTETPIQGLYLVNVLRDGNGVPTSRVRAIIDVATLLALPSDGEAGTSDYFAYDIQTAEAGDFKSVAAAGRIKVNPGVTYYV